MQTKCIFLLLLVGKKQPPHDIYIFAIRYIHSLPHFISLYTRYSCLYRSVYCCCISRLLQSISSFIKIGFYGLLFLVLICYSDNLIELINVFIPMPCMFGMFSFNYFITFLKNWQIKLKETFSSDFSCNFIFFISILRWQIINRCKKIRRADALYRWRWRVMTSNMIVPLECHWTIDHC